MLRPCGRRAGEAVRVRLPAAPALAGDAAALRAGDAPKDLPGEAEPRLLGVPEPAADVLLILLRGEPLAAWRKRLPPAGLPPFIVDAIFGAGSAALPPPQSGAALPAP